MVGRGEKARLWKGRTKWERDFVIEIKDKKGAISLYFNE